MFLLREFLHTHIANSNTTNPPIPDFASVQTHPECFAFGLPRFFTDELDHPVKQGLTIERSKSAPPDLHKFHEREVPGHVDIYDTDDDCETFGHKPRRDSGNVRTRCEYCFWDLVRDPVTGIFTRSLSPCLHTNITRENDVGVCIECHQNWDSLHHWKTCVEYVRHNWLTNIMPCYRQGGHHKPQQLLEATHCVTCQQPIVRDATTRNYELVTKFNGFWFDERLFLVDD